MSTVLSFSLISYDLPFEQSIKTAKADLTHRKGWLLRVHFENQPQFFGFGEIAPWPGFGLGMPALKKEMQSLFSETLKGSCQMIIEDASMIQSPSESFLLSCTNQMKNPELQFAFELAMLDLFAQSANLPLSYFLRSNVQYDIYPSSSVSNQKNINHFSLNHHPTHLHYHMHSQVKTHALVANREQALVACRSGYEALKFKIGAQHWTEDLLEIAKIKDELPKDIEFRLDANQAFDLDSASGLMVCANAFGIHWVEEPLSPQKFDDFEKFLQAIDQIAQPAGYSKYLDIPFKTQIALDESLTTDQINQVLVHDSVDLLILKPMFVGGLIRTRQLAIRAKQKHKRVCITHALDRCIGRFACAHLCDLLISQGIDDLSCGLSGALIKNDFCQLSIQNAIVELPLDQMVGNLPILLSFESDKRHV